MVLSGLDMLLRNNAHMMSRRCITDATGADSKGGSRRPPFKQSLSKITAKNQQMNERAASHWQPSVA